MSGRKIVGLDGVSPVPGHSRNLVGTRPRPIKPSTKGAAMTAQTVDPRVIAEALQMDTYDLAAVLVKWAGEALPGPTFETSAERGPMPLDVFDERVATARRYLESAHAAFEAWDADNPEEPTE